MNKSSIYITLVILIMNIEPSKGSEFDSLLKKAENISDVKFNIVEMMSTGGSTVTNTQAQVVSSRTHDMSIYIMMDDTGHEIMKVFLDGGEGRVYYKIQGEIAEAPPDEAEDTLSRMHTFYLLRPLYDSGSDVYYAGESILDGRSVHVYNMYRWGEDPNRWYQVFIDSESGVVYQQFTYDGDVLNTRIMNNLTVNQSITEDMFMAEYPPRDYPVMSAEELLVEGKRPSTLATREDDAKVQEKETNEVRIAHFEKVISNLRSVIENGQNEPKILNLLATTLCSKAYLSKNLAEADESIAIYRTVLSLQDLSEYDKTESMLGMVRVLLCKAYLASSVVRHKYLYIRG